MAAHLCPPTAIRWKAKASHPSKSCRATSTLAGCAYSAAGQAASVLHSGAVLQFFQAKMLANEEAGLDSASLRDLRSATDLALRERGRSRSAMTLPLPKVPRTPAQDRLGSGPSEILLNSQAERGGARVLLPLDHTASSL